MFALVYCCVCVCVLLCVCLFIVCVCLLCVCFVVVVVVVIVCVYTCACVFVCSQFVMPNARLEKRRDTHILCTQTRPWRDDQGSKIIMSKFLY